MATTEKCTFINNNFNIIDHECSINVRGYLVPLPFTSPSMTGKKREKIECYENI